MFLSRDLNSEFVFSTSRSSGPGGQNVNKVNTKIEIRFNIPNSLLLSDYQKSVLVSKLASRLTSNGDLIVVSQQSRSQLQNKEAAIVLLYDIVNSALKPIKLRKATRPSRAAILRIKDNKKRLSAKKRDRRDNKIM